MEATASTDTRAKEAGRDGLTSPHHDRSADVRVEPSRVRPSDGSGDSVTAKGPAPRQDSWSEWGKVNKSINKNIKSGAKSIAKYITRDAKSALMCVQPAPDSPPSSQNDASEEQARGRVHVKSASTPALALRPLEERLSSTQSPAVSGVARGTSSPGSSPVPALCSSEAADRAGGGAQLVGEVKSCPGSSGSGGRCWSEKELVELAHKMSTGLEIRDRNWILSTYRNCFVGEDAVRWLVAERLAKDEKEAVMLGNMIGDLGLVEHVTRDHAFKNAYLYYHFTPHCFARSAASTSGAEDSAAALEQAVKITSLQRTLADLTFELEMQKYTVAAVLEAADQNRRVTEGIQTRLWYMDMYLALLGVLLTVVCLSAGGFWGFLGTLVAASVGAVAFQDMRVDRPRPQKIKTAHASDNSHPGKSSHGQDQLSKEWEGSASDNGRRTFMGRRSLQHAPSAKGGSPDDSLKLSAPTPEEFQACPDRPLLLRLKLELSYQRVTEGGSPRCIPINRMGHFEFETRLFAGRAMLWVTGLPTSPPGLFKGRQRKTSLVVQGRFKEALPFDDVFTGQEFQEPIRDLPASWLVNVLLRIARKLSPSSIFGLLDNPHILTPVVAGAQCINISKVGAETEELPDLNAPHREDMLAMLPTLTDRHTGEPLPSPHRKKWFTSAKNRAGLSFDTENLYTFHFWQHLLDLSAYELDMGVAQFDISSHLNGQPLQLMVKQQSTGEYLWNFEVWHENLLKHDL